METFDKALQNAQEELKNIAYYLCDGNEQEAESLLVRTNEIAIKYRTNEDLKKWLLSIMKYTFLDEVKKRIGAHNSKISNNSKT